jgi:hypothetical protein
MKFLNTPLRRLEGISYWVIEDPSGIRDFINREIQKEWETDARFEHRDPKDDSWLKTLPKRKWSLEITDMNRVKLNPEIMNYVDTEKDYVFSERLAERSQELQKSIKMGGLVVWPLIVRKEDMQLADGYCRFSALKAMNVSRTYVYVGTLAHRNYVAHSKRLAVIGNRNSSIQFP